MDSTALVASVLAATMVDDDSNKESGSVGCGSLTLFLPCSTCVMTFWQKCRIKMSAKITGIS